MKMLHSSFSLVFPFPSETVCPQYLKAAFCYLHSLFQTSIPLKHILISFLTNNKWVSNSSWWDRISSSNVKQRSFLRKILTAAQRTCQQLLGVWFPSLTATGVLFDIVQLALFSWQNMCCRWGDSQILLKWTVVITARSWKALSQCSELFYWGGKEKKKKVVIWALNDLNDKSEASHLYATFVREILLGTKLQIVCWIKGYEN